MRRTLQRWWNGLKFEPDDPRYLAGGEIKIAAIGGGTGLSNLLRGLKQYSSQISAIVTVADNGGSSGEMRKEFDMLPPGDIRQCISALACNEELISQIFNYRFSAEKKNFGGHTLGNIWLTALSSHFNSFEKAVEVTTEIFQTAGKVLPATLENIDLEIAYADGTKVVGEENLDEIVKKIKKIALTKKDVAAYPKAVEAIREANLIIIGPGSLYGSIIPNILIDGIRSAVRENQRAVKVYVANCSTERTQTAQFSIGDHIKELKKYAGERSFDYCLVNNRVISSSSDDSRLGEINNITTEENEIDQCKIVLADVIREDKPLYHDSEKLAKSLIELYNRVKQ